jgi:hypothetical protein
MNNIDVISKYITEAKMKLNKKSVKDLIKNKKSGKYEIDGNTVELTTIDDTLIITYPSDMVDFTYALAQASDDLGYDYNQIGLGNKKKTKFIIDLS